MWGVLCSGIVVVEDDKAGASSKGSALGVGFGSICVSYEPI